MDTKKILENGQCKKTSFVNEKQALLYIEKIKKTSTRTKSPKSAYLCPICLNWHLTHYDYTNDLIAKNYEKRIAKLSEKINNLQVQLVIKDNTIANKEKKIEKMREEYLKLSKFKGF